MKVNISGRGVIPGIGTLAPIYGYDASKDLVARILNFKQFHVYVAANGTYITPSNIDKVFAPKVVKKTSKPTAKPIPSKATPEMPEKQRSGFSVTKEDLENVETTIESTTELVESVKDVPLPEITEDVVTEESTYDPVITSTSDDDPVVDVTDDVDTAESTEDTSTEETKPVYYNKKKKNKNNRNR